MNSENKNYRAMIKRFLTITSLLLCASLAGIGQIQEEKKAVAVYIPKVTTTNPKMPIYTKVLSSELQMALTSSPKYKPVERSEKFLELLSRSGAYDLGGAVNLKKIKELGKQESVDYVLAFELTDLEADNKFYTIWKLIDVEKAIIEEGVSEIVTIKVVSDLTNISKNLVKRISGNTKDGFLTLAEGEYRGELRDGMPNGKGKIVFAVSDKYNRIYYEGEWKDGKKNGQGTMVYKNGSRYEGSWANDKRSGMGTYYTGGYRYEGSWADDMKDGQGKEICSNGEMYEGSWLKDKRNGAGIMHYSNGNYEKGYYKNGYKDGEWKIYKSGKRNYYRREVYDRGNLKETRVY